MTAKRVCVPLAAGFEEIETFTPVDLLRRAGVKVALAALGESFFVEGRSGISVKAEVLFDKILGRDYDMLLFPGGPGVKILRRNHRIGTLTRDFAAAGRWIAAICAAPLILKDSGLLLNKRYTAHASTLRELPDALARERVVRDGNLITSRGAGTAVDFGLELVRVLVDDATADKIAQDIMV